MGALQNLEKGQIGAALNDIKTSVAHLFTEDLVPVLTAFIEQFATDFGAQALTQAAPLALQVISGQVTIQQAGVTLGTQLTADAVTDAEKDGTVALNALRVQITAQTPVATATPAAPVVTPTTGS